MICLRPDDPEYPVAEVLARHLLDCARDDPMLVRRSRTRDRDAGLAVQSLSGRRSEPLSPITLESHSEQATRHYLEDLVSLAVESAQQSDLALQQALKAKVRTKRGICTCVGIASIATLIGAAGMARNYFDTGADRKMTEIASEVRSLSDQQLATSMRLAAVRTEQPVRQDVAAVPPRPASAATPNPVRSQPVASNVAVQAPPTYHATSVNPLRTVTYSSPWPTYHRPTWPTEYRRPAEPRFLSVIMWRVRTLFK